jgi:hypothetical protein
LATVVLAGLGCGSPRFFSDEERGTGGGGTGADGGEGMGASDGGVGAGAGGTSGADAGGANTGGTATGGATTGGASTGGAQAGGGAGGMGGSTGGATRGGMAGSGSGGMDPQPVDIRLVVEENADDAVWIGGSDERLTYSEEEPFVEVGADDEVARSAFRFVLPIPRGATIESASLRLVRRQGTALPDETMAVQVFDSATVAPFNGGHAHPPAGHDPGGLFALVISGFAVGEDDETIDSPDLASLVSHVIERSDYDEGGALGFVLSADDMAGWAMFSDSASGEGASLAVRYLPP